MSKPRGTYEKKETFTSKSCSVLLKIFASEKLAQSCAGIRSTRLGELGGLMQNIVKLIVASLVTRMYVHEI